MPALTSFLELTFGSFSHAVNGVGNRAISPPKSFSINNVGCVSRTPHYYHLQHKLELLRHNYAGLTLAPGEGGVIGSAAMLAGAWL